MQSSSLEAQLTFTETNFWLRRTNYLQTNATVPHILGERSYQKLQRGDVCIQENVPNIRTWAYRYEIHSSTESEK